MRVVLHSFVISAVLSAAAAAQTPAVEGPGNEPVSTDRDAPAQGPVKGANSFTEGQARDRALAWGATNLSSLAKDPDGIWRGTATWDGKPGQIAVDYKGNVVFKAGP